MTSTQQCQRGFSDPRVREVFEAYSPEVQRRLLELRELVFATAEELDGVGSIVETLRWGEPTYLAAESKSGTMIRLDCKEPASRLCSLYVHCQTDLIETFKARHGDALMVEGKRALLIHIDDDLPLEPLRDCIALALTYRLRKAAERNRSRRRSSLA